MLGLILGGISAAGSLLGGLGASSAAKSQQRRQLAYDEANKQFNINIASEMMRQVPQRIAGDAQNAGFNPVTWLNAGALSYYSNAFGMMRSDGATQAVNIPSALSAVGSAISSFGSAYGQQARFDANLDFQQSALGQNLKAMGQRAASHPQAAMLGGPGQSSLGGAGLPLYSAGSAASSRGVGGLSFGETDYDPWTGVALPKGQPAAQKAEDFGGEIAGEFQGIYNLGNKLFMGAFPGNGTWAETIRRGLNYQVGPKIEWNNPFRNPNLPPGYSTGGGFTMDLTVPFAHYPYQTGGGF